MPERYLVSTTMGDSMVDPNSWVYVPVDNRHFVRKRPYKKNRPTKRRLLGSFGLRKEAAVENGWSEKWSKKWSEGGLTER